MTEPAETPPVTPPAAMESKDPSALLTQLFGGAGDFGEAAEASAPPVHWPSLSADEIGDEMRALHEWVTRLQQRFREMVRLPAGWHRHNGLVELLAALRDHERASYADTAAPTSALGWHMAFRDVEARLRAWVADLRCGGDINYHDETVHAANPPDTTPPEDLAAWIGEARKVRQQVAVQAAVNGVA
jgi:hypothetical protein